MLIRAIEPPGPPVMAPRLLNATPRAHHGDDGDQRRQNAPERQLAPHAAAIDDEIGIERHGVISSN